MIEIFLDVIPPKATHQGSASILRRKDGSMFVGKKQSSKGAKVAKMFDSLLSFYRPSEPLTGPVALEVTWTYPWRSKDSIRDRAKGVKYCDTRPDSDNLLKTLNDSLTRCGYFADDGQVADLRFIKMWGDKPGINIKLRCLQT